MSTENEAVDTFESVDPATDLMIGRYPVHDAEAVRAAVERGRVAGRWWAGIGADVRARRLSGFRSLLARRAQALAELVHRENGKPVDDALLEITLAVHHLAWAARHAGKVLSRDRVPGGILMPNQAAAIEYVPYGVVGVIGPWNYPVFTPMGSITSALAAGNAVVYKPSEYTPAVAAWLVDAFATVVPEYPVLQLVTGFGATGAALSGAGVDKLAFTGSTATGRAVLAACARTLTPAVVECGGNDAMIVDFDADLDAAADAALWGGMSNAGQTCIGVERVYAVTGVYEPLLRRLVERAAEIRPGDDREASYGPMTAPEQIAVVRRQVEDALARGARAVVGGPDAVKARYIEPIILIDVPGDAEIQREETFGPVLTVTRVADADQAVDLANATPYGLSAVIFADRRGAELAGRVRAGMVSVNSVISYAAVPGLPFGGVGDSGFGRVHGVAGLREFSWPKAVTRQRFGSPMLVTSFRRAEKAVARLVTAAQALHGRAPRP